MSSCGCAPCPLQRIEGQFQQTRTCNTAFIRHFVIALDRFVGRFEAEVAIAARSVDPRLALWYIRLSACLTAWKVMLGGNALDRLVRNRFLFSFPGLEYRRAVELSEGICAFGH